jgi:hypothetical protein
MVRIVPLCYRTCFYIHMICNTHFPQFNSRSINCTALTKLC